MTEETTVVNQEEANLAPDQEQEEQVKEQVESDISTTDGKDYKAIAEQLSKDIKEKNRKIQELKSAQTAQPVEAENEDETVKRFLETEKRSIKAEANYEIMMKMQSDSSFKDRADIVKDYVEQGYNIEMADRLAKADIMDKILSSPKEETPNQPLKQIKTQAIPEQQTEVPSTGNGFKDMLNDPNMPEAAKEAIRRSFSSMM